jgi:glycosyltransferase involved in cell wall biosynthesis
LAFRHDRTRAHRPRAAQAACQRDAARSTRPRHAAGLCPLPGYAQHWDAALLPFRDTAQIRACNPLKLREYLAAGRPVVTTEFPALDGYRDLVRVADSPEAMATALEAARAEGLARVEERRARVADQSWDRRAADVAALLDAL